MNMSKPLYTMSMTEEELIEALEYYTEHVHGQKINIKTLKHKVRSWTEGFGMCEMDHSEPDGIEFTCE